MEEAGRKLFETSLSIFFVISYEAFSVLKLKVKGKKMPLGFKRGIGEILAPEDFGSTLGTRLVTSLGFGLYSGVVSPTYRRRLLLERWFVTHSSQEKGAAAMVHRTASESMEVRREAGRVWGKLGPEPLLSL